jgi:hypothetical protein
MARKIAAAKVLGPVDAFIALPDDEKERVWRSLDRVIPDAETRPLTADEQARWEAAVAATKAPRRRPGRPHVGRGSQRIQMSVDRSLLAKVDAYAKAHGLTRSEVFARGVLSQLRQKV